MIVDPGGVYQSRRRRSGPRVSGTGRSLGLAIVPNLAASTLQARPVAALCDVPGGPFISKVKPRSYACRPGRQSSVPSRPCNQPLSYCSRTTVISLHVSNSKPYPRPRFAFGDIHPSPFSGHIDIAVTGRPCSVGFRRVFPVGLPASRPNSKMVCPAVSLGGSYRRAKMRFPRQHFVPGSLLPYYSACISLSLSGFPARSLPE